MCALLGLNSFGRIFPKMKIGVKLFQILPNRESVKSQNDFFLPYTHTYTQHIRRKNLWLRNVCYLLKPKIIGLFFVTKNFSLKKKNLSPKDLTVSVQRVQHTVPESTYLLASISLTVCQLTVPWPTNSPDLETSYK